jgi:hypothetical protein
MPALMHDRHNQNFLMPGRVDQAVPEPFEVQSARIRVISRTCVRMFRQQRDCAIKIVQEG